MTASTARRVAWTVGIVSILLHVDAFVFLFVDRHAVLPSDAERWSVSSVLGLVTNIAVPVIGIALASRRRENPLGWMFLAAGFSLGLGSFGSGYGLHALKAAPGSLPAGNLMGWKENWIWAIPNGPSGLPVPAVPHGSAALAAMATGGVADRRPPAGHGGARDRLRHGGLDVPVRPDPGERAVGGARERREDRGCGRPPGLGGRRRGLPDRPVPPLGRGRAPPAQVVRGRQGAGGGAHRPGPQGRAPGPGRGDGIGRYPQDTEAAVCFCCLEALQNVSKYADATSVRVRLSAGDGELAFEVCDDGRGFDPDRTPMGSGLQNMVDRLAALGGSVEVRSSPGEGATVHGHLPVTA